VDIIADYFSPNYEQKTANEKIDYTGLVDYIKALMEDTQTIQIYLVKKRSMKAKRRSLDIFQITRKNGRISNFAVLAIFEIQNDKIILSWELTKIILGDEKADTIQ
jgi:hypothetical protein